jgi:pectinesterase
VNALWPILIFFFCFSALPAQTVVYDFVVDQNGKGDFTTVQEAIDAVPFLRKNETKIHIRNGIYKEKLSVSETKTNVTLIGEDVLKTILTYDDYASKHNRFGEEMGTSASASTFINGDNFKAENITFENSAGPVGQAVAVRIDGDMATFINCRFLGFQDTLYPHGEKSRQYYRNCYIEGTTDFIFGWSTVVFENCEIYSKKGGQYITAASTLQESPYGFVFVNCKLTGDAPVNSVYLGRPWRPFARTVLINCELGKHIKNEGWHNWNKPEAEKTAFYAEYQSSGPGANPAARVIWSQQLSEESRKHYTLKNIFNGWVPYEGSVLNI